MTRFPSPRALLPTLRPYSKSLVAVVAVMLAWGCSPEGTSPSPGTSDSSASTTTGSSSSSQPSSTSSTSAPTPSVSPTASPSTGMPSSSATGSTGSSASSSSTSAMVSPTATGSDSGSASEEGMSSAPSSETTLGSETSSPATTSGAGQSDSTTEGGYDPCPTDGPCVIMPYGDSITEGFPVWGGYRIELFRKARQDNHAITFVGSVSNGPAMVDGVAFPQSHEGHGGFTIKDEPSRNANGIFRFARPSLTQYKPHIVLLMVGTNDINGNIDTANAPRRLGELLDEIHSVSPEVLVVLAQIVPTQSDGTNQAVRNYNSAIPELVSSRSAQGRHLLLVDMYGEFTSNPNYKQMWLGDNLHPNEAGYAKMAEVWYAAIEGYLH